MNSGASGSQITLLPQHEEFVRVRKNRTSPGPLVKIIRYLYANDYSMQVVENGNVRQYVDAMPWLKGKKQGDFLELKVPHYYMKHDPSTKMLYPIACMTLWLHAAT